MITLIAGSRDISPKYRKSFMQYITKLNPSYVLAGGARGVDTWAVEWAIRMNRPYHIEKPNYVEFDPKIAPIMRNRKMAGMCNEVYCFYAGTLSSGTANMVKEAKAKNRDVTTINVETNLEIKVSQQKLF